MIIILIFAIIIIGIFCYIFFAPFFVEINTAKDLYRIRLHRFALASLLFENTTLMLEIKILNWKNQIDLSTIKQHKEDENIPTKSKNENASHSTISLKKIVNVLKSFKVNQCKVAIDTGNIQLNAFLYPIFYLIQIKTNNDIQINFVDNNEIILEIENNLARMSWAYLSS